MGFHRFKSKSKSFLVELDEYSVLLDSIVFLLAWRVQYPSVFGCLGVSVTRKLSLTSSFFA